MLTDVISFAVIPIINFSPTENIPNQNPAFPAGVGIYDTWSDRADNLYDYTTWSTATDGHLVPYNQGVLTGLQISIRVWDEKTQQARQVTLMVDM
jgi:hypothetical protein